MNIHINKVKLSAAFVLFLLFLLPLISFGQKEETVEINNQKFTKVTEAGQRYLLNRSGVKYPLATSIEALSDATLALDLSNKQLKTFPAKILQYPQLQILLLNNNQIRTLPIEIEQLSDLRVLNLKSNLLRKLPKTFGQLQQLRHLSLEENILVQLPDEIGQLAKLVSINLKTNILPMLPSNIGQLKGLVSLDVSHNQLAKFPTAIGQLKQLQFLTFNKNQIEILPKEIGRLSNLIVLEFWGNDISSIPNELGQLKKLASLKMNFNPINTIPDEIKQLKALQVLRMPALATEREETIRKWFPEASIEFDYDEPMFVDHTINPRFREEARKQFQNKNYQKAFYQQQKAVKENGGYIEWHNLSFFALFVYQPKVAIEAALKAKERNKKESTVETNLALGYVLNDEWDKAEAIYSKWKGQPFPNSNRTWDEVFLQDIADLEASGVSHTDFDKIKKMLRTKTPISTDTQKNITSGTFKDERDGQTYKWIRLKDGKKWMAQNLNYEMADSWCYDNETDNCAKYGRLYNWEAALKACPKGWRLPSEEDWWAMTSYYGKAYNKKRGQEKNDNYWADAGGAAYKALLQGGDSGFSNPLAGYRDSAGDFQRLGEYDRYWSSTEESSPYAWNYDFYRGNQTLFREYYYKQAGLSCRCLQN